MVVQTTSGKAFEYALLTAAYKKIHPPSNSMQKVTIQRDGIYHVAKDAFESCSDTEQEKYAKAASAAIRHIATLEPRLGNPVAADGELVLALQSDQRGADGDIRDVLVVGTASGWEVGFSAKNENNAVKHSRLSDQIDFGEK